MTEPRVTNEQLDLMRHTVGLDQGHTPYRNYFAADDGHVSWPALNELVEMGLMVKLPPPVSCDMTLFHLTEQGFWMLGLDGTER